MGILNEMYIERMESFDKVEEIINKGAERPLKIKTQTQINSMEMRMADFAYYVKDKNINIWKNRYGITDITYSFQEFIKFKDNVFPGIR